MPLFVQIILIVVPCVALVLGGRALSRRLLSAEELEHAERAVPFLLGTVGGFFGLLSGFMLSNAWSEVNALRDTMSAEVNALADMANIAARLPQPHANELEAAVFAYLKSVVDDEIPKMKEGRTSPATTRALHALWDPLAAYQPTSNWESTLHGIAISKVMEVGQKRRQRLSYLRDRSPTRIWWILLMSGLVVVSGATFASLRYKRTAAWFLGALVAVMAVVLFTIHVIERPFEYGLATGSRNYWANWAALGGRSR